MRHLHTSVIGLSFKCLPFVGECLLMINSTSCSALMCTLVCRCRPRKGGLEQCDEWWGQGVSLLATLHPRRGLVGPGERPGSGSSEPRRDTAASGRHTAACGRDTAPRARDTPTQPVAGQGRVLGYLFYSFPNRRFVSGDVKESIDAQLKLQKSWCG